MGLFFNRKKDISNMAFDWDAYWADIAHGISAYEKDKKFKNFDYYVPKSVIAMRSIPVANYAK